VDLFFLLLYIITVYNKGSFHMPSIQSSGAFTPHPSAIERLNHIDSLQDRITELSAHIQAANYQLLILIRTFDECAGWSGPGMNSCAHWLNWKCGTSLGVAREKVRVAHALKNLPQISAAFSKGASVVSTL
jgi:hypothetical protein